MKFWFVWYDNLATILAVAAIAVIVSGTQAKQDPDKKGILSLLKRYCSSKRVWFTIAVLVTVGILSGISVYLHGTFFCVI